jgi:DNA replication and repair protein RecF
MGMLLKRIHIRTFRNIKDADVQFGNRFNIFFGNNGQGKTNLLEAIFFLATVKSFRHAKNKDMIAWDEPAANLRCTVADQKLQHDLFIAFDSHGRQLKVDGKNVTKVTDYCNIFSVVAFSPEELGMVCGSPEQRRRYLDRAIFSSNSEYLGLYYDYFRALKQRNQLLKSRNYAGIEAWTDQLASAAARLVTVRNRYVNELAVLFFKYYQEISGSDEEGRLCYHANSLSETDDPLEVRRQLCSVWAENSRLERERGMTLKGPHRDDLEFILNNKPIREHGSQGQQKSFVIALKMAEIEYLEKISGRMPILLLDDMTAELDSSRIWHLMKFMADRQMQVFITTTDPDTVPLAKELECSCFHVESGRLV